MRLSKETGASLLGEARKQLEQIEELARKEGFGSAVYNPWEPTSGVRQGEQFS